MELLEYLISREPAWKKQGTCRGLPGDWWFTPDDDQRHRESALPGIEICQTCAVRQECLNYALTNGEKAGIWGGLTTKQRRALSSRSNPQGRVVVLPVAPVEPDSPA